MRKSENIILKKLLIIWIALGIAISGYFFMFPMEHKIVYFDQKVMQTKLKIESNYSLPKISSLIMVVGAIVIGGFGYINKENN